jgi:hypothetical protein
VFAGHERIVGSVANLIVAERARSHGVIISFRSYFVVGAPLTILSIVFGAFWLSLNGEKASGGRRTAPRPVPESGTRNLQRHLSPSAPAMR